MTAEWPILRRYDADHLERVSLPLGGIGTGTVGLGGRGDLRDVELGNRPAKGFRAGAAFALLRTRRAGEEPRIRVLEGPIPESQFEGPWGASTGPRGAAVETLPRHEGLPRFATASFETAYPLGRVILEDDDLAPVVLEAFNPLVPGDLEASSIPVAVLRYIVRNDDESPLEVSVAFSMENFVGSNGTEDVTGGNVNVVVADDRVIGVRMSAPGITEPLESAGEVVLAALRDDGVHYSHSVDWGGSDWTSLARGRAILDLWDDLADDGRLDERDRGAARPSGVLAAATTLAPGEARTFRFLVTWAFPNRRGWGGLDGPGTSPVLGNHYTLAHPDPWATARRVAVDLADLERRTVRAVTAIAESSVPAAIREAALFNVSTMRTETVFRTADGRFWGWEGTNDRSGSCLGNSSHVWAYEFATAHWFAELSWSFRETQFGIATDHDGFQDTRIVHPVEDAPGRRWLAVADGQMACLVHLYADWRLSGDDDRLRRLWPAARRSLEFAWIPGGWDADRDGVMEGCQHYSLDNDYYGPNSHVTSWYLAALAACAEMGEHVGDDAFAAECRRLAASGSAWVDDNLFDGGYYRQRVIPRAERPPVAAGLRMWGEPPEGAPDDHLQIGEGVNIDQVVGQYAASVVGLGDVLDPDHVRSALAATFRENFVPDVRRHLGSNRAFVMPGEGGVVMTSWPGVPRPRQPQPYADEIMTGFEYALAAAQVSGGDRDAAVTIVEAIRRRYDGRRRNPFDEAECGHHYARAMAAWSVFLVWNGFSYDARTGVLGIDLHDPEGSTFWSTGSAFGTWTEHREAGERHIEVEVIEGRVRVARLRAHGVEAGIGGDPERSAGARLVARLPGSSH